MYTWENRVRGLVPRSQPSSEEWTSRAHLLLPPGVCSLRWLLPRQTSRQGPCLISSELAAHGTELGRVAVQFVFDEPVMGRLAKHSDLSPCAASPGTLAFTPTDNNHKHNHLFANPTGRWLHWGGWGWGETGEVGSIAHSPDQPFFFIALLRVRGLRDTC